jgi:hypothetical protein
VLLVKLNRRILKVHAVCHGAVRVRAPECAMRDRESCRRLKHPAPAHDFNPDVAAELFEELDGLRVMLP